ncbi:MAG TPA: HAD-IC family P-type ATPase, partial [Rhizomicrobium sp.]|nr:HAD-IC family P-type ATPase [Rhizomicrobium sp.]
MWVAVLCANFAEALGEVRERVRADNLRRSRRDTLATRITGRKTRVVPASKLRTGDVIVVKAGELIPVDGEVIEGIAMVDESVVTGESAPVLRESSSDQSTVTCGSRVLSDEIHVRVTRAPAETLVEKMISALENTTQEHTRDEIALQTFTSVMALICVVAATVLFVFARFTADKDRLHGAATVAEGSALLAAMLPITVGALLSTTGAAGMGRLVERNVLAMSRRSFESVYNLTTVFLDKTGTVTGGNRHAVEFLPCGNTTGEELIRVAALASLADETTEGRSIVELASKSIPLPVMSDGARVIAFSSYTRMSGIDVDGHALRKGAADAIADYFVARGAAIPEGYKTAAEQISQAGGTPLGVGEDARILGIIHLMDIVKPNLRPRVEKLRAMGIRTILITGDNPVTAAAIASEVGAAEFVANATPADKLAAIKREQARGEVIA